MIGLLQRVSQASVVVDGETVGAIGAGLMVLLCAERNDTEREADLLLSKLLSYRVFSDDAGKMNRSVTDVAGGLLLVPQFTLAADTQSGTRLRRPPRASACSIISSRRRGQGIPWWKPAVSARTCRFRSPTMAR
jgi:D-tyrosyl-tRNA(Tyr) deacylase